jgi:bifunctional DNA-binding transcriptional regulator/antitoxin component of YhaV-PrlF toxin-antitoxin module
MKLTIHTANERLVVALPQQIVARLGWSSGDVLEAEVVGDALKLVRVETANDRTMRTADDVMDEYAWTLEELAKS